MLINEIEAGEKKHYYQSDVGSLVSTIKEECSEIIRILNASQHTLYRGVKDCPIAFLGKPREDRNPLDSSNHAQELFDTAMKNAGYTALRSNSIFCSTSYDFAAGYGAVHAVFPKNGFSYTWSTKYRDLVDADHSTLVKALSLSDDSLAKIKYLMNMLMRIRTNQSFYDLSTYAADMAINNATVELTVLSELAKDFHAHCSILYGDLNRNRPVDPSELARLKNIIVHLKSAIENISNSEYKTVLADDNEVSHLKHDVGSYLSDLDIIFKCIINVENSLSEKFNTQEALNRFGLLNTDFRAALDSGHEICIAGVEYYAISKAIFPEVISEIISS